MVDRQERQRMGEIAEWEGVERGEEEEEEGGGGQREPYARQGVRADTPRPSDDGGRWGGNNTRGSEEGFMRSGSGKSVERGARKEVRWSKDVDYEG